MRGIAKRWREESVGGRRVLEGERHANRVWEKRVERESHSMERKREICSGREPCNGEKGRGGSGEGKATQRSEGDSRMGTGWTKDAHARLLVRDPPPRRKRTQAPSPHSSPWAPPSWAAARGAARSYPSLPFSPIPSPRATPSAAVGQSSSATTQATPHALRPPCPLPPPLPLPLHSPLPPPPRLRCPAPLFPPPPSQTLPLQGGG